jgi:anti-sigma factor RsiW
MHRPIQEGLEDYLSGKAKPEQRETVQLHLSGCAPCRVTVEQMEAQARLFVHLRAPAGMQPAPGFYARVLERIEAQTTFSFWSFFLEPSFGKRLVIASAALFLLLATVAVTSESKQEMAGNPVEIMAEREYDPTPGIDVQQDRDVVLGNLASWREDDSEPTDVARLVPVRSE